MTLSVLSESQIDSIHAVSMRILCEIGVRMPHKETVSRLDRGLEEILEAAGGGD